MYPTQRNAISIQYHFSLSVHYLYSRKPGERFHFFNSLISGECTMPSIQVLSDLHLEAPKSYNIFGITPTAPYLALLGDIGCVRDEEYLLFLEK